MLYDVTERHASLIVQIGQTVRDTQTRRNRMFRSSLY